MPLDGIVRSPVLEGYRNKSEFTIGPDADGLPTVGFNVGLFKQGVTAVASPEECRHISPAAKTLAAALQAHLRAEAETMESEKKRLSLPVWDKRRGAGFWRLLTVREGGLAPATGKWSDWVRDIPASGPAGGDGVAAEGASNPGGGGSFAGVEEGGLPYPQMRPGSEVMVLVQVAPTGHEPQVVRGACKRLAEVLHAAAAAASPCPFSLTKVMMQVHEGVSNAAATDAPLLDLATGAAAEASGSANENVIHEELCGLRFSLSATAFFQVNTCAAEVLYRLAGEWASPTGRSLLLDVCCGTGTIGLTLAAGVGKVVGVDIVENAVEDAKANAALNGIVNCEWVAGGDSSFHAVRYSFILFPFPLFPRFQLDPSFGDANVKHTSRGVHSTRNMTEVCYLSCSLGKRDTHEGAFTATAAPLNNIKIQHALQWTNSERFFFYILLTARVQGRVPGSREGGGSAPRTIEQVRPQHFPAPADNHPAGDAEDGGGDGGRRVGRRRGERGRGGGGCDGRRR